MDESSLYHQIAESIRQEILNGRYKPGDRLPPVRRLAEKWRCTAGTIQRAYSQLAREGLVISRAGQGTRVAGMVPPNRSQSQQTLRRASLVNRMEAVLLEMLTAGYGLDEIRQAMDVAMDRWRAPNPAQEAPAAGTVRFAGSHDVVVGELTSAFFGRVLEGVSLQLSYSGSLGGLIALAEGKADLAGCHLWDEESDSYNLPFIRRLLPGREARVVTLAHRRQGLIVAPGNPLAVRGLTDLSRPGLRFVNRQPGSGTRVWLDAMLRMRNVDPLQINGYADERLTHSDVARAVANGSADVGLGLEAAAQAFGLGFIPLNRERYDLVMFAESADHPPLRTLVEWLESEEGKAFVAQHPGYDSAETGTTQA